MPFRLILVQTYLTCVYKHVARYFAITGATHMLKSAYMYVTLASGQNSSWSPPNAQLKPLPDHCKVRSQEQKTRSCCCDYTS